ncbi:MAG: hypothetical protein ABSD38_29410 [Syntrophorhabdales bacterium]|jgi:hypothetical protein
MKDPDKLSTLLAILAIAFFSAAKSRMITVAQKPVRRKAHSRPDHPLLIFGRAFFNKRPTLVWCDPIKSLLQTILLSKRHSPDSHGPRKPGTMDRACVLFSAILVADRWSKAVVLQGRSRAV